MITVRIKIIDYDKASNTCTAQLLNGGIIEVDPFVSCAIKLSDKDYESDKGFEIIGNSYLLIEYHVYKESVTPSEGGMIKI